MPVGLLQPYLTVDSFIHGLRLLSLRLSPSHEHSLHPLGLLIEVVYLNVILPFSCTNLWWSGRQIHQEFLIWDTRSWSQILKLIVYFFLLLLTAKYINSFGRKKKKGEPWPSLFQLNILITDLHGIKSPISFTWIFGVFYLSPKRCCFSGRGEY